ncbi:MAG TPA: IS5 family transposase [Povalibacter sp.]
MCCAPVVNGRHCPRSDSAAPARCTSASWSGRRQACSRRCGGPAWPSTTRWKASPGDGKASTRPCSRRRWRKRRSDPTRPIGGKKGSKRHLLVDGRGVPLSLVVTGANKHDVTQLDAVLQAIMVKRKTPSIRRSKHLCADAGYRGWRALEIIESHGYIPRVVSRPKEAAAKRRNPAKKARRWVVEVCHSWFNRFRKLLVRYEKLERSFMALNHIAAAIIAFRKVKLTMNIIYG